MVDAELFTDQYSTLCTVETDISTCTPQYNLHPRPHYTFSFELILLFGVTELKAQIAWMEHVRLSSSGLYTVAHLGLQGIEKRLVIIINF